MGHANLRLVREVAARIPDPKTRSQILGEVAGILGRAGAPQEFEQAFAEALQALREAVTSKFSRALTRSRHGPAEPSGDLAPSPAEDRDEADDLADEDADMESEEPAPDLDPLQLLPTVTRERLKAVEEAARSGDARHLQEALDLALVPVLERDAHERAAALGTLAGVLLRLGRPQEAERLFDEALRAYRDIRGIPGPWGIYGHTQLQRQRQVIAVWRQALRELLHEGEAERILRWVIRGSDPDFNPLLKECAYPLARAGKLHLLLEHLPDLDTFRDTIAALARSGHLPEISLAVNALCTRPHVLSGTPLNNLLPRLAQLTSILAELGLHEEAERLSQLGQRRLLAAARAFLSEHASSRQPPSLPEFALLEEDPPPPHKQEEMEQHEAQEPEMWFQKAERAVEVLEEAFDLTEWLCASGLSGVAAAILDAVEDFLLFLEEEMVEEDLGDSAELLVRAVANLAAAGRVRDAVRLLDHLFQTAEHVWEDYLKYAIAADPDGGFHSFLEVLQKRCSDVVRAFLDAGAQEEARRFFHAVSAACEFGPAEERKALEPVLQQLMEKGDLEAARQVLWLARPSVRRQLLSTIAGFASSGTAEWAIPFVQAAMRAAVRAVFGPDKILLPRSPLDVEEEPWERPTGRKRSSVWLPADLRSHIRGIASGSGSDLWVEEAALAATACWSDEALAGCVEGLGSLGRFGEALVLSSGISDVPTRFRVLNGLLSRMEQEGYLSEVEQHAESEFDPETRAVLLAAIGDRLRATGQTEEARARFREALEAAETAGRSAVLAQVVRAAAELLPDASERCLSSVRGIPRPEARCQRLLDLAVPSAQLGLWDIVREAIEVGVDVYDEGWPDWGELGRKLGAAVACTGSADGIIQLLKTVAGCLRFVDSPEIGAHELVVGISEAVAWEAIREGAPGDLVEAMLGELSAFPPYASLMALVGLASVYTQAGRGEDANRILTQITEVVDSAFAEGVEEWEEDAWQGAVGYLLDVGMFDLAARIAETLGDPDSAGEARNLAESARLLRSGEPEEAAQSLQNLVRRQQRQVMTAVLREGEADRVLTVARRLGGEALAEIAASVARRLVGEGRLQEASALVGEVEDGLRRAELWLEIAQAAARDGNPADEYFRRALQEGQGAGQTSRQPGRRKAAEHTVLRIVQAAARSLGPEQAAGLAALVKNRTLQARALCSIALASAGSLPRRAGRQA